MKNAKVDASLYLLSGLLQRLEERNPGLIDELKKGVDADRKNISHDISDYDYMQEILNEAQVLLERIENLHQKI